DLFEAMYTCRAMRRLKPDPVPEELLIKLVEAATMAPSGSNAQSSRWIVVRDRGQKEKLAELNMRVFRLYTAPTGGRAAALPHQSEEARERMLAAVRWQAEHFAEIPALIIACLEFAAPPRDTFAAGAGAGGSVWPGVQNLLLAARALGLGATPTTFAISDRAAARAVLNLPETIEPFCLIPVGWPMGKFGPVTRRPVSEVMRWDRWS
ncbi:MAG TPA: nitroreductase family protein, partial [Dehalococcoidia bacterium]|nr:nitroreductase family protein [Dehalococcoidia bacterium]